MVACIKNNKQLIEQKKRYQQKKSGSVLIVVLVMVAIAISIVASLNVNELTTLKLIKYQQNALQSEVVGYGAISFARAIMVTSHSLSQIDTLADIWAKPLKGIKITDNIEFDGYIIDEQSKFNLNSLVDMHGNPNENVINQFNDLLNTIGLPQYLSKEIVDYIRIHKDQKSEPVMKYLSDEVQPTRPASRLLVDITELYYVKQMDPEWIPLLNKYVSIIPSNEALAFNSLSITREKNSDPNQTININTASSAVIAAKAGISNSIAEMATKQREELPFKSKEDILNFFNKFGAVDKYGSKANDGSPIQKDQFKYFDVSSSFFTLHAQVRNQKQMIKIIGLMYAANRGYDWPILVWKHHEN